MICAIEFFRMVVQSPVQVSGAESTSTQVYHGAVVFGGVRAHGCEIVRIIPPTPNFQTLYEMLSYVHVGKLREKLIFHDWDRTKVLRAIQSYCQEGQPLPNIFDPNLAALEGLSDFQYACYRQACRIDHGDTKSYAWLAEKLQNLAATRAVGGALKSNPFPLAIPCHRVVKKSGTLGGYLGTQESMLQKSLLEKERLYQQPPLFPFFSDSNSLLI